jgi:Raf kinase inhibitor-like YbhB/YbcL family protein
MLEKIPSGVGRAIKNVRAGAEDLAVADTLITGVNATIEVSSPAFEYNGRLPPKYTADGEGLSPPIRWIGVPSDAVAVVLLVEDADSPTRQPLVHAIVWDLPGSDGELPEGALPSSRSAATARASVVRHSDAGARDAMGRNSYLTRSYLPPDPPPGHGPHRYVFQVFALDSAPRFDSPPGRSAVLEAIKGHVVSKGLLIGTYERA